MEKAEFDNEESWYRSHDFYRGVYGDDLDSIPWEYRFNWYIDEETNSVIEGAKLYLAPDNIKPDWKELLEECKEMLRADGVNFHE